MSHTKSQSQLVLLESNLRDVSVVSNKQKAVQLIFKIDQFGFRFNNEVIIKIIRMSNVDIYSESYLTRIRTSHVKDVISSLTEDIMIKLIDHLSNSVLECEALMDDLLDVLFRLNVIARTMDELNPENLSVNELIIDRNTLTLVSLTQVISGFINKHNIKIKSEMTRRVKKISDDLLIECQ
jgi:hypothetical protein